MKITKENITAKLALDLCETHYIKGWTSISYQHPRYCPEYDLTVVGDCHLPCGKRVHIVKEELEGSHIELNNALVFSLQDAELEIHK